MQFSFNWALAVLVFVCANLFLGVQLVKLIWPLRALRLSSRMRREATDPQAWLSLAADEDAVRRAVPVREAIFRLQRGDVEPDEVKYRKLWFRSWAYTIATLLLFYIQPQVLGEATDALTLTLVLCQSLAAYAQGLLVKALAEFRRCRVRKFLDAELERREAAAREAVEARAETDAGAAPDAPEASEAAPETGAGERPEGDARR